MKRKPIHKGEFRAIVVTTALVICGVILPPLLSEIQHTSPSINIHDVPLDADLAKAKKTVQSPVIDINAADSLEWKALPGIGPVLCKRIVKFRDKLGGFHSIDQVGETYGLSPETFETIKPRLRYSTPHVGLELKGLDARQAVSHPYVSWEQAKALERLAQKHPDQALTHLNTVGDSIWIRKMLPYLKQTRP